MKPVIVDELAAFDKKVMKHFTVGEWRGTRSGLVKGLDIFVGIAQCVEQDQFNRRKGRKIALGRSLQSWKEDAGVADKTALRKHSGQYYFKVSVASAEEIDAALVKYIFMDQPRPK